MGRIAALNAASDVFAMGARPIAALASATLPTGSPRAQQQALFEFLSGSLLEWRKMGATLAGGHTLEGPRTTIGFTVLGECSDAPRQKGGLQPGDSLILTKPIGTGVLLAAHAQCQCRATWMECLVENMLQSNEAVASLLHEFKIAALTDVTGFGLAGHLDEMLRASQVDAELSLEQLPLLPGAQQLFAAGQQSTMAPANRDHVLRLQAATTARQSPRFASLFDPQTSGGLLLGVEQVVVPDLIDRLRGCGHHAAAVIGHVTSTASSDGATLSVRL